MASLDQVVATNLPPAGWIYFFESYPAGHQKKKSPRWGGSIDNALLSAGDSFTFLPVAKIMVWLGQALATNLPPAGWI